MEEIEKIWSGWKMVELIGQGGYGKVYKIKKESYGQTIYSAVKVIAVPEDESEITELAASGMDEKSIQEYYDTQIKQMIAEIGYMVKMKADSHVVSIEDWEVKEEKDKIHKTIYIRMELLDNLDDFLKRCGSDTRTIVKLGMDICTALEYCHAQNIIHRDIKPSNIFVSERGDFKLGDFGVARQMGTNSMSMSRKGTYSYMAPEMLNSRRYNHTADIYALGLVLYSYLNHGRMPFLPSYPQNYHLEDREKAFCQRIAGKDPIPLPDGCDPKLGRIVCKACAYHAKDRYQYAKEMKEELRSWLSSEKNAAEGNIEIFEKNPEHIDQANGKTKTDKKNLPAKKEKIPAKRPKKKKSHAGIIIGLICLILLGIGARVLWNKKNASDAQAGQTSEQTQNEIDTQNQSVKVVDMTNDREKVEGIDMYLIKNIPLDVPKEEICQWLNEQGYVYEKTGTIYHGASIFENEMENGIIQMNEESGWTVFSELSPAEKLKIPVFAHSWIIYKKSGENLRAAFDTIASYLNSQYTCVSDYEDEGLLQYSWENEGRYYRLLWWPASGDDQKETLSFEVTCEPKADPESVLLIQPFLENFPVDKEEDAKKWLEDHNYEYEKDGSWYYICNKEKTFACRYSADEQTLSYDVYGKNKEEIMEYMEQLILDTVGEGEEWTESNQLTIGEKKYGVYPVTNSPNVSLKIQPA
ncbi:MAG: serine/threonine protein kinase [Clostridia bacterium]|nr:serine/threonine protein kinase [Clostridia bacterium]